MNSNDSLTLLEAKRISKIYLNGVYANNKVDFDLKKGEIHALVGENGAGKSTLMKILYGIESPDSGVIELEGKPVQLSSPHIAIKYGIGMVHQHFMLVPSLTVAENITLGYEPGRYGYFNNKLAYKKTEELAKKYNFNINPDDIVENLSVGLKQKVEILKALIRGAKIIILDEPTAVLTPQETKELFKELKQLRDEGHTIIFISHKLKEVKIISDRVSIMRKGQMITTVNTSDINEQDISQLMIGKTIDVDNNKKPIERNKLSLVIKDLSFVNSIGKKILSDISFSIHEGEIVGIIGVEGNGQTELATILAGLRKSTSGTIEIYGKAINKMDVRAIRELGSAYIPEDRMLFGIASDVPIWENLISNRMKDKSLVRHGILSNRNIFSYAQKMISNYNIVCSSNKSLTGMLSGGNIQKVVVARELSVKPKIIIAEQPTRGIDVGSADFIHRKLNELRGEGSSVLLISADIDEVLKLSDSILVLYNGRIVAYFPDAHVNEMQLGRYMLGLEKQTQEELRGALYE